MEGKIKRRTSEDFHNIRPEMIHKRGIAESISYAPFERSICVTVGHSQALSVDVLYAIFTPFLRVTALRYTHFYNGRLCNKTRQIKLYSHLLKNIEI